MPLEQGHHIPNVIQTIILMCIHLVSYAQILFCCIHYMIFEFILICFNLLSINLLILLCMLFWFIDCNKSDLTWMPQTLVPCFFWPRFVYNYMDLQFSKRSSIRLIKRFLLVVSHCLLAFSWAHVDNLRLIVYQYLMSVSLLVGGLITSLLSLLLMFCHLDVREKDNK